MGLLNFVGKVAVGTIKVGVGLAGAIIGAAVDTTKEANNIRNSSQTKRMSDAELINGFKNTSNSTAQRMAYGAELKDRHGR